MKPNIYLIVILLYKFSETFVSGFLLYPQNTVFQVTTSIAIPFPDLPDLYRMFIDIGFQVNYNMPWALSEFYRPLRWQGLSKALERRETISYEKYSVENGTHPSDATAGEIYMALEDAMISYGFHETCLLKSVCELGRHPFDLGEENLLAEMVNFVLSPSQHKSFNENEKIYREAYEAAERYGANGVDCDFIYPKCPNAVINVLTKVLHE